MKRSSIYLLVAFFAIGSTCSFAVTTYVGDVDGFGFDPAVVPGLVGWDGNPADRNGNGILDIGDVLPDLNADGIAAVVGAGGGDVFDHRSAAEASDPSAQWTDVSLANQYANAPGGEFWKADGASLTFTFTVPNPGDPDYGLTHYASFVYGDYDVDPMYAIIEGVTVNLLGNQAAGDIDGYIWSAYAPVSWDDMLDGEVTIDIIAPNEPYVAFDYAVLDARPIHTPVPGAVLLVGIGTGFVGWLRRRRAI